MGSISAYNFADLIFEVSEEVATQIAKNCCRQQPHTHLKSPPTGTHASIRIYFIFPETRVNGLHFCRCVYGSIFIQFCAAGSKRRIFSAPESNRVRFGRSRSFKVDDFATNRKRVCDFLLVGHCDYGPILYRFWDLTGFMCSWVTPPLFNPNFGGVPVAPDRPCWASARAEALSYSAVKLLSKKSNLCVPDTWTDRRDGQTDDMQSHNRALRLHRAVKT